MGLCILLKYSCCRWSCIDLWSIGVGRWGLSALVSVHSSICETYSSAVVFDRSIVDWRRGCGLSALVSVHTSIFETESV